MGIIRFFVNFVVGVVLLGLFVLFGQDNVRSFFKDHA